MPKPRRNTRRFKKRKGKKSRTNLKSLTVRGVSVIPDRMFVKLRYVELGAITASGASNTVLSYRGNGAYDPNVLLGGHSPLGFDDWSLLYEGYKVHKSSISIKPVFNNTNNGFRMILHPSNVANTPVNPSLAVEQPYVRSITNTNTSTTYKNFVSSSMMTKKFMGVPKLLDDDFGSQTNNLPKNQWFWVIHTSSFDGVSTLTVRCDIRMTFWIEFFQRKQLQTSGGEGNEPFGQTGVDTLFPDATPLTGATGTIGGIYGIE